MLVAILGALAACGDGDSEEAAAPSNSPTSHTAPTIEGTPRPQVVNGTQYSFVPSAQDADEDELTFTVSGLPPWASFDPDTGEISGTPGQDDLGSYSNIVITVSDGSETASLGPFEIAVVATASGSALLSWTAPTDRTDGSPLSDDLAGFKIYWGASPETYTESVTLDNPGLTSYLVEELTSGTWYFAATAFDSAGAESAFSTAVSKTIP